MNIVYLRGTSLWSNLTEADKYDNYGTNLVLDDESLAIFRNLKTKAKTKIDEKTNKQYVKLNRKKYRTDKDGVRSENTPVKIVDKDGNDHEDNIGNGSTIVCKCIVYDTSAGRGMRLEAVMIEELKAYTKPTVTKSDSVVPF